FVLRPWYARLDEMTARAPEVAIGSAARALPRGARVLLEVRDFGYFAVEAASGHPELFVLDRTLDPREPAVPSSFAAEATLRARLARGDADYLLGAVSPATAWLGPPLATAGDWALWANPGRPPPAAPSAPPVT